MGCMNDNTEMPAINESQFKYMDCRYCGTPIKVSIRRKKSPSHVECGIAVAVENAQQIQAKSGPAYDRWLAGQSRYLENLTRGGAPSNDEG